ncbi:hypothetical protein DDZ16_12160 [Marinilabilia rubra]|uniref:Uncharacterized protein n=1 Tax=Marinilabilia rubra TaxID=2162893 RepID=A0A2U2B7I8_9BACT|nr:hypothetical protein DDZ16_12160 [Marinilabilia rubra]
MKQPGIPQGYNENHQKYYKIFLRESLRLLCVLRVTNWEKEEEAKRCPSPRFLFQLPFLKKKGGDMTQR